MAIFNGTAGDDEFFGENVGTNTFTTGSGGSDITHSNTSNDIYILGGEGVLRYRGSLFIDDVASVTNKDIIDLTAFIDENGADGLNVTGFQDDTGLSIESGGSFLIINDLLSQFARAKVGFTFRYGDNSADAKSFTAASQYQDLLEDLINSTNRAPVVLGETAQTIQKGQSASFFLDDVALDRDGDPLAFSITKSPAGGTAAIGNFNRFTFTPDANRTGEFKIGLRAEDSANSVPFELTIKVTGEPPQANDDAVTGKAKQLLKGLKIDVLKNDTSELGKKGLDKASLEIVFEPADGVVSIVKNKLVYKADPDFSGVDTVSYRVADKTGLFSDIATVVINGPDLTSI